MDASYTVMVNVGTAVREPELVDRLSGFRPVVSPAGPGHLEVVLTFRAPGLRAAVATALDLVEDVAEGRAIEVEAATTDAVVDWFEHPALNGTRAPAASPARSLLSGYTAGDEASEAVQ